MEQEITGNMNMSKESLDRLMLETMKRPEVLRQYKQKTLEMARLKATESRIKDEMKQIQEHQTSLKNEIKQFENIDQIKKEIEKQRQVKCQSMPLP